MLLSLKLTCYLDAVVVDVRQAADGQADQRGLLAVTVRAIRLASQLPVRRLPLRPRRRTAASLRRSTLLLILRGLLPAARCTFPAAADAGTGYHAVTALLLLLLTAGSFGGI